MRRRTASERTIPEEIFETAIQYSLRIEAAEGDDAHKQQILLSRATNHQTMPLRHGGRTSILIPRATSLLIASRSSSLTPSEC